MITVAAPEIRSFGSSLRRFVVVPGGLVSDAVSG